MKKFREYRALFLKNRANLTSAPRVNFEEMERSYLKNFKIETKFRVWHEFGFASSIEITGSLLGRLIGMVEEGRIEEARREVYEGRKRVESFMKNKIREEERKKR